MSIYTNKKCACCAEKFTAEDEVVVCPICGAPYHRSCYEENGKCIFSDKHAEGFEYALEGEETSTTVSCKSCGEQNPVGHAHCSACGEKLEKENYRSVEDNVKSPSEIPYRTLYGDIYPNDDFDGVTAKEIAMFTGSSSPYFLMQFKMMKDTGKKISLNLWAFLGHGFYYIYRKMYALGGAMLGLLLACNLPMLLNLSELIKYYMATLFELNVSYNVALISQIAQQSQTGRFIYMAVVGAVGVFANHLYMRHSVKTIKKVKGIFAGQTDSPQYYTALAKKGRTNIFNVLLLLLLTFGLFYMLVYNHMAVYFTV